MSSIILGGRSCVPRQNHWKSQVSPQDVTVALTHFPSTSNVVLLVRKWSIKKPRALGTQWCPRTAVMVSTYAANKGLREQCGQSERMCFVFICMLSVTVQV